VLLSGSGAFLGLTSGCEPFAYLGTSTDGVGCATGRGSTIGVAGGRGDAGGLGAACGRGDAGGRGDGGGNGKAGGLGVVESGRLPASLCGPGAPQRPRTSSKLSSAPRRSFSLI